MTAEEKLLFKLMKARRKEERLTDALMKIEPKDSTETVHDPEVLTPEEHFYYLKMGHKSKNYVPIGRRGVYQGVILNMHLHWKKHQTLKVIVKTFTPQEVREIASELARLSGGIVLDIHEENTIIMYRGKNYSQPPTEIMSPRITLPRKKALDKSKHRDGLRAVRLYILKLEEDLELLQAKAKREGESKSNCTNEENPSKTIDDGGMNRNFEGFGATSPEEENFLEEDSMSESGLISESEDLSDIFEMDSEAESGEESQKPLYLDTFEKFPSQGDADSEDFEEHLRQISTKSKKHDSHGEAEELPELDEIDRIFLNVGSLLNKKRR
ncbi:putative CRM domain-containing protein [Acorus calamus]|uniref:CRM domain-containing protein n=1 Tax=Acorus calamus TaxID=4465 RepID=A0AAV9ENR3_ACOCL|nr:putative CRM domain-containing protein [Acorus calamus]